MIGKSWSIIQHNIQIGFAIMSFTLNSTLIFLILRHSPKSLGAYKYLMIYISAFELFYSLMDIIVKPIFHSYGSTFLVMVSTKETGFSLKVALFLGASMAIFGIHFIYRYLVAAGSNLLEKFNLWKTALFLFAPVVYGAVWGWVAYDPVGQQPATGEHIRSNIMETFDLELDQTVYIGPYFYQKQLNGSYQVDFMSIVGMSVVYLIVSSSFFTIFYFGIKCYRIISQLVPSTDSYRSKQLQSHLFWALVTQTMIPVILMHTPVTLVYAFALLDKDIGMLSGFVSMTIAAYPAIDPLPSILIIPCYRRALRNYFTVCKKPKQKREEGTAATRERTGSIASIPPT